MPVSEQVRVDTHTGNGSSINFAYNYRIFADADLQVVVDGVLKTLTTDYTVNGAGDDNGGSIDFVTAPINLSVVTISGELTYDRATDYIDNGDMRAETVDNDFDKSTMQIQQLRRDVKRSIKVPIEETNDQEISFTPANRASKVSAFDASGNPTVQDIVDISSLVVGIDESLSTAGGILSVVLPNREFVAGGTVNAITGVTDPPAGALTNNLRVYGESLGRNTIVAPTLDLDGLGAKAIVKEGNVPLSIGDIGPSNSRFEFVFDLSLDKWILMNPIPSVFWVDVKKHGVVADGSANDAPAMLAAVAFAESIGIGRILLPEGTIKLLASVTYSQNFHFIGTGQGTIIDNQAGDYAFKNVMTANGGWTTFEKMKISGANDATAQGGVYAGDPSGGSFFPSHYAFRDFFVKDFAKAGAIGMFIENVSHLSGSNVKVGDITNGTALVVRGTRVNTGVFSFDGACVFGAGTTDLGAEFGRSGDAGPVDSISAPGAFFKGTTAAIKLFARTVNFLGTHFEVGSGATQHILVDSWLGGGARGCTFGGDGADPDYGIYAPAGKPIKGVSIDDCEFTNILSTGACVKIEATGSDVENVKVGRILTITTDPSVLDDASGNVQLEQVYSSDNSDNSTSGTGQDDFAAYTISAGHLGVTGGIEIKAAGTKTNGSAEAKTLKLRFGTKAINILASVTTATDWRLEATIVNTATGAQRISWICYDGVTVTRGYDTATEDTTATVEAKLTGEVGGTGTDVITQTMSNIKSI